MHALAPHPIQDLAEAADVPEASVHDEVESLRQFGLVALFCDNTASATRAGFSAIELMRRAVYRCPNPVDTRERRVLDFFASAQRHAPTRSFCLIGQAHRVFGKALTKAFDAVFADMDALGLLALGENDQADTTILLNMIMKADTYPLVQGVGQFSYKKMTHSLIHAVLARKHNGFPVSRAGLLEQVRKDHQGLPDWFTEGLASLVRKGWIVSRRPLTSEDQIARRSTSLRSVLAISDMLA